MRSKKPDLEDVVKQFEAWRAKPHGRLIPDRLWKAALGLLDRYAPSTICRHLRVNPARFKQVREARGGGSVTWGRTPQRRRTRSSAVDGVKTLAGSHTMFVELPVFGVEGGIAGATLSKAQEGPGGCRLTVESPNGTLTVVTANAGPGLVDAVCQFVVGALRESTGA